MIPSANGCTPPGWSLLCVYLARTRATKSACHIASVSFHVTQAVSAKDALAASLLTVPCPDDNNFTSSISEGHALPYHIFASARRSASRRNSLKPLAPRIFQILPVGKNNVFIVLAFSTSAEQK